MTYNDIQKLEPCHDINQWIKKSWEGSIEDLFKIKGPTDLDKLWVVLRIEFMSEKILNDYCDYVKEGLNIYEDLGALSLTWRWKKSGKSLEDLKVWVLKNKDGG